MYGPKKKRRIRLKKCPACKGEKICKQCNGTGEQRIINARSKGSTFERSIAKDVTKWSGIDVQRTPLSGGWNSSGDITPKEPEDMVSFPFSLECKNQEMLSVSMFFKEDGAGRTLVKLLRNFWIQCANDADKYSKVPLLIVTKANEPTFVVVRASDFLQMGLKKELTLYLRRKNFRIFLWKDFIKIPYKKLTKKIGIQKERK